MWSGDCKYDGCGFASHSKILNIRYFHFLALVARQNVALSSATQHAMPPEFGGKWETDCFNTCFNMCTGYSVILKKTKI